MGGGKGKQPPPPDYSQIAAANKEAAQVSAEVAREQLAWAKEQYAMDRADTTRVNDTFLSIMDDQAAVARMDRERYVQKYQGLEDKLIAEAEDYATPARQELEAGKYVAAVDQQFEAARQASEQRLASFGLDPSQIRSGALDLGTRVQEASAKAAAANAGRDQAINVGRALRSEAINIGRGYPGQVAQSVASAVGTGQGVVQGNINTTMAGAQSMGTPTQWQGLSNQALGNWGDYSSRVYSAQQAARSQGGGFWGGVGNLLGSAAGRWLFEEGGQVPAAASPSGGAVPDDVPAQLTAGEMVVPRDVVLRKGTEFFEKLFDKTRGVEKPKGKAGAGKQAQSPSDAVDGATIEQIVTAVMQGNGQRGLAVQRG